MKTALRLALAACLLWPAAFVPAAQEADDIVINPELRLESDRVDKKVVFSLREAAQWQSQARAFEREGKSDKAFDAWREAFARYESLWRDFLGPEVSGSGEPLARSTTVSSNWRRDEWPIYIETWVPLPDYINSQLRAPDWPRQFRDRLAMRQGGPGNELLKTALEQGSTRLLRRCARYCQFSAAGAKAMRLLAELSLERGDSLLAARWLFELGLSHPDEFRRDPSLWLLTIRAYRECDSRYYLDKMLRDLERVAKDATVDVEGRKVNVAAYAQELAQAPAPAERNELRPAGWRTMSGDNTRNRVAPPVASLGEMIDLGAADGVQGFQLSEQTANPNERERYGYGNAPSKTLQLVFPAVHHSGLYVHQLSVDNQQSPRPEQMLGFMHGAEQRPVPMTIKAGAAYPKPKDDGRYRYRYYYDRQSRDRWRVLASTVGRLNWAVEPRESDVLFAVLGEGNPSSDDNAVRTGNQIQAFDLGTEGKHLVTLPNEKVENAEDWRFLQRVVFNGAPLVRDNKLYVTGTFARRGSTEAWAFCFDVTPRGDNAAGEGKLQWKTMLCARKTASAMWGGDDTNADGVEVSSFAEQGGMLYVSTHLGAAAGLDRDSGELCWVAKYERPNLPDLAWQGNSPIAAGGMVVLAPDDSRFAFVLDGISGVLNFEHPKRGRGAAAEFQYALGVVDNRLIIQGKRKLYSVALTSYRPGGKGKEAQWASLNYESVAFGTAVAGRGVIAGSRVLVPLQDGVAFFDVHTGKLTTKAPYPSGVNLGEETFTLTVFCRGEAIKDAEGAIQGYRPATVTDPKTGAVYSVEHLTNGESLTLPSGAKATVVKETFVALTSSKWLYLFKASDK